MVGSRWSNRLVLLGVALCAVSCEGVNGNYSDTANGDLGYIDFRWVCTGQADLACEPDWEGAFPRFVALGSRFDADFAMTYRIPSQLNRGALLVSSDDGIRPVSGDYEALEETRFTLMALMSDDSVADFASVEVRPVDSLRLVHGCSIESSNDWDDWDDEDDIDDPCGGTISSTQVQGRPFDVRVEPYGGGEPLIGDLDYEWEVLTPGRLSIVTERGNDIRLNPTAPGPGEVVVRLGELSRTLTFTIDSNNQIDSSGPTRTRPGGSGGETEGETETEGDTGDTDTDSGTTGETDGETETDTDAGGSSTGGMR